MDKKGLGRNRTGGFQGREDCKAGVPARHPGLWGATGARGSVPRTSVIDLSTQATITGSNPRIPPRMPSPSEGFQLVFY